MVKFCQRMGWGMLAVVLDHMRDRLQAGARDDLLEMAQVAFVKSWTARLLWENGFRSVRALAEADAKDIVPALMMVSSSAERTQSRYTYGIYLRIRLVLGRTRGTRIPKRRQSGMPRRCAQKRMSSLRPQISCMVWTFFEQRNLGLVKANHFFLFDV
jgi:hypothetical protein